MRRRQKHRGFGHTGGGTEYCPGYVDRHGQWNNGFYCPKWGGPERRYCCGTDTERYCCPEEEPKPPQTSGPSGRVTLTIGLTVGCLVMLTMLTIIMCHVCRCCWAYKRRKRTQQERHRCPLQHNHLPANYAVNYTSCPHRTFLSDVLAPAQVYPMEDPPPYPGESAFNMDEKIPLNQQNVSHNEEQTDDEAAGMTSSSNVGHSHDNLNDSPSTSSLTRGQHELQMYSSANSLSPSEDVLENQDELEQVSHDQCEPITFPDGASSPVVVWTRSEMDGSRESVNSQLSSHMDCTHTRDDDFHGVPCTVQTCRDFV